MPWPVQARVWCGTPESPPSSCVLPTPERPRNTDVLCPSPFEEADPRQLAEDLPIDRGLRGEGELVKHCQRRESRLSEWALGPVLMATTPFDVERLGDEAL